MEGLKGMAIDPEDPVLQDQVVRLGEVFTSSVRNTSMFITSKLESIREDMEVAIGDINDKLATVANLNLRLKAAGGTLSLGDLQDQRDSKSFEKLHFHLSRASFVGKKLYGKAPQNGHFGNAMWSCWYGDHTDCFQPSFCKDVYTGR